MKLLQKLLPLLSLFSLVTFSQVTNEGLPTSWFLTSDELSSVEANTLPSFDLQAIKDEDKTNDYLFDKPWRFGYMHSVDYGLEDGNWDVLDNGDKIWRILISSEGALSLNFIFDNLFIPKGGSLYLYNDDHSDLLGAYTHKQNQEGGVLGTWLVNGDSVWIEYYEPLSVQGQGTLHIAKATHGYRNADTFNLAKGLNDSGDCNLDIDCSIGEDWEELKEHNKRSAGILLSGGSGFCSGALINNTENDGTPYFLTANHCYSNPASWAFRFGWISPNSVCATTENSSNGPTNMTISGATLRARDAGSDFALVEINSEIPEEWDRVFAGWDKSDNFPEFQVGIHHPSGDVMKVCRDDNPATKEVNGGAQTWEIVGGGVFGGWEIGVTEPGSSGSPLFDQEGRIIGQLFGGGAAC
ncbi:MAG: serine protease, partial [Flavobacteriaceae bacterium]|nr:serine protease [Flavobacteriaceae bacterium]